MKSQQEKAADVRNCEQHVSHNFTTTNLAVRIKRNAYLIKGKVRRSADNTQQLTAAGCSLRITYGCQKNKKCFPEWNRYTYVTCNWLHVQKRSHNTCS